MHVQNHKNHLTITPSANQAAKTNVIFPKSLIGMEVLIVDRSEFVNSKGVYSALLVVREDDDEPVDVAEVEASDPVPVSLCACTPNAAKHSIHAGRVNMIAVTLLSWPSLQVEIAGNEEQVTTKSRQAADLQTGVKMESWRFVERRRMEQMVQR